MLPIDLRSDTVTRPDKGMLAYMCAAPLGDDVFGDDPTTQKLEETAAALLGKERAIFVPSGTMANSIAIGLQAAPGSEVILEASAHSFQFEAGGGARLWGAQMLPMEGEGGRIAVSAIRGAVRPADVHFPRTRLLILEQTSNLAGGKVLPLGYLKDVGSVCREEGLSFHLDGARIFNAQVASGIAAREYAACADTVMFSISKGLGAPAGSLLLGKAELIQEARRLRKVLGGGMRQTGLLAACGLYALEHNLDRLAEDHSHARALAKALQGAEIPGLEVAAPETNMVYAKLAGKGSASPAELYPKILASLKENGVLAAKVLTRGIRFVFHKDIPREAASLAADIVLKVLRAEALAKA